MLISSLMRIVFYDSKNYINAFKVRSRLADFFKHIHPDQMSNAPVLVLLCRPKSKTKTCAP